MSWTIERATGDAEGAHMVSLSVPGMPVFIKDIYGGLDRVASPWEYGNLPGTALTDTVVFCAVSLEHAARLADGAEADVRDLEAAMSTEESRFGVLVRVEL
jgi:hypothetical protein